MGSVREYEIADLPYEIDTAGLRLVSDRQPIQQPTNAEPIIYAGQPFTTQSRVITNGERRRRFQCDGQHASSRVDSCVKKQDFCPLSVPAGERDAKQLLCSVNNVINHHFG